MEEDWVSSSDPEQAASDFGASGKNWQGDSDEDAIMTQILASSVRCSPRKMGEVIGVPALRHDEENSERGCNLYIVPRPFLNKRCSFFIM